MTKLTVQDLPHFYRNAIGIDRVLDRLQTISEQQGTTAGYPPYNIIRLSENRYEIQVAVAGFTEGEINLHVENSTLVVKGEKSVTDNDVEYLYRGISARKFIRTFSLAEYVEVIDAEVVNGILSVHLEQIIPDSLKPKTINITYKK